MGTLFIKKTAQKFKNPKLFTEKIKSQNLCKEKPITSKNAKDQNWAKKKKQKTKERKKRVAPKNTNQTNTSQSNTNFLSPSPPQTNTSQSNMTIDDSKIFDFDGMCFSPKVREVKKKGHPNVFGIYAIFWYYIKIIYTQKFDVIKLQWYENFNFNFFYATCVLRYL